MRKDDLMNSSNAERATEINNGLRSGSYLTVAITAALDAKDAKLNEQAFLRLQSDTKITVLEERIAKLREALEFYASVDHYDTHPQWGRVCMIESDSEFVWGTKCSGKLARQALAEDGVTK